MNKGTIFLFILIVAQCVQVTAQKYLNQEKQSIITEYNGHKIYSDSLLSVNLKKLEGIQTFAAFLADYEQQKADPDYMGTFFVILDEGFESAKGTEILQQLGDKQAQYTLIESLMVPGRLDARELRKAAAKSGGVIKLKSERGALISIRAEGDVLQVEDSNGRTATLVGTDLLHRNGFFHILGAYVNPAEEQ